MIFFHNRLYARPIPERGYSTENHPQGSAKNPQLLFMSSKKLIQPLYKRVIFYLHLPFHDVQILPKDYFFQLVPLVYFSVTRYVNHDT